MKTHRGRGVAQDGLGTLDGIITALQQAPRSNPQWQLMQLAASALADLHRRMRPKLDARGDVELVAESGVSAADGTGRVHLSLGRDVLQTTPSAARGYALQILAAAADAEGEAALTATLLHYEFPLELIGQVIQAARAQRAAREATGASTA